MPVPDSLYTKLLYDLRTIVADLRAKRTLRPEQQALLQARVREELKRRAGRNGDIETIELEGLLIEFFERWEEVARLKLAPARFDLLLDDQSATFLHVLRAFQAAKKEQRMGTSE